MPPILAFLASLAMVLYIVLGYLIPFEPERLAPYGKCMIAWIITVVFALFWFVLPIHIG